MRTTYFLLIALGLGACAPLPEKAHTPDAETRALWPADFHYSAYGFAESARDIKWEGDHLVYHRTLFGKRSSNTTRIMRPTAAQWQEFWHEMDAVDIWDWRTRYVAREMVNDGFAWQFNLARGKRAMKSAGDNAYPSEANPRKTGWKVAEPTKRFDRFDDAVMKLIGEKNP